MAGGETQKQLLTLIRDYATEKSQGERKLADQRKRTEELRSGLEAKNAEHEDIKHSKEFVEQEIKGYEFELSLNESSIQAIESRNSLIQDEISKIQSEIEVFQNDGNDYRDEFIRQMVDFNKKIRELRKMVACTSYAEQNIESSSYYGDTDEDKQAMVNSQVVLRDLEDQLDKVTSQTHVEEQKYQENQINYKRVQQEVENLERQALPMEAVVKEMKELQEVSRQIAESEEAGAGLGEKLQGMCACPRCHVDNAGALGDLLGTNQGS